MFVQGLLNLRVPSERGSKCSPLGLGGWKSSRPMPLGRTSRGAIQGPANALTCALFNQPSFYLCCWSSSLSWLWTSLNFSCMTYTYSLGPADLSSPDPVHSGLDSQPPSLTTTVPADNQLTQLPSILSPTSSHSHLVSWVVIRCNLIDFQETPNLLIFVHSSFLAP